MRRRHLSNRLLAAAASVAVALGAAACSSSDESSSSSTTTTSAAAESTTTTASGTSVDCAAVQTALTSISTIEEQATSEGSSFNLEQFNQDVPQLKEQASVIEQQAEAAGAPAEALQLYTERNTAVIGLLEQLAQNQNQQEFQTAYQAYQTPEYDTAAQEVGAALKAQCPTLTD